MLEGSLSPRCLAYVFNDLVSRDPEGLDLPDLEAAVREAHRGARSLAAEQVLRSARPALNHFIQVEDPDGAVVAKVRFRDAVAIKE